MAENNQQGGSADQPERPAPTFVEWTVRSLSFVAVAGLLIYLTIKAVSGGAAPAFVFQIDADRARLAGDEWAVPVGVTNTGTTGISALVVEVDDASGPPTQLTIPLLGPGQEHQFHVYRTAQPTATSPTFRVLSYQ